MLNRRELIASAGGAVLLAASTETMAHDHEGMAMPSINAKLVETASDCIKAGEACTAHCLSLFASGDTTVAACAKSVDEMLSICGAVQKLASAGSSHLPEMQAGLGYLPGM